MSWQTNSAFLEHVACPKCGSSDANAVYDDGHTYCFSCHAYTPPTRLERSVKVKPRLPAMNLVELPDVNRRWLQQWLTDDEIDEFFVYDALSRRHAFIHHLGEEDSYAELRTVNNEYPKTISHGTKPHILLGPWKESGIVVVVEDIVSAIKVSRVFGAMPMFGSWLGPLARGFLSDKSIDYVCTWYDSDKWTSSVEASRLLHYMVPATAIYSELDPKYYSTVEIKERVYDALSAFRDCSVGCV